LNYELYFMVEVTRRAINLMQFFCTAVDCPTGVTVTSTFAIKPSEKCYKARSFFFFFFNGPPCMKHVRKIGLVAGAFVSVGEISWPEDPGRQGHGTEDDDAPASKV
jgi:hypothetical protein